MTNPRKNRSIDCLLELKALAENYGVNDIATVILNDKRFQTWSGSPNVNVHHYGNYGLIIHTHEVVTTSLMMAHIYPQYEIDEVELYLASLFHDIGKTHDYEFNGSYWVSTEHKQNVYHIARSALIWNDTKNEHAEIHEKYGDKVLHAILAHHGQKEWGSPVTPNSRVAWILHLCDNLSARLDDIDTIHKIAGR